jgi:hypothetical protein
VLTAAADQAIASGTDYGIAIERRAGKSDPGHWLAWLTAGDLHDLIEAAPDPHVLTAAEPHLEVPVRLLLRDFAPLLHAAGYGDRP